MDGDNYVRTKDLPIINSASAITDDDRVMFVCRVKKTEDLASYSIRHAAFTKGIMRTFWDDGSVSNRYYGSTDPNSTLGKDGDLYFQYDSNKTIIAMLVKYNGSWQNL